MNIINKKVLSTFVVALFFVSIVGGVIPVHAMPVTYHVYAGQLIQPVIDGANAGDKIVVHEGTYIDERILIDKALTLKGDGAVLEYNEQTGNSPYFAIHIEADGVRISGFKIVVTNEIFISAIEASAWSGTVIDDNIIEAKRWGVSGYGAANVEVRNNEITSTTPVFYTSPQNIVVRNNVLNVQAFVPYDFGNMPIGIRLPGSPFGDYPINVEVKNNEINSVDKGIYLENPLDVQITRNEIHCANIGLELLNPSDVTVKYNVIYSDSQAIYSDGSSSNLIISNNVMDAGEHGIRLMTMGTNTVVTGNIVCASFLGIFGGLGEGATVKYNVVSIRTNTNPLPTGIVIFDNENSQVAMNIITGDFISGIFLAGSSSNTLEKNIIIGVYRTDPDWEDAGIRLNTDTSGNTVKRNVILRVTVPIDDMSGANIIIP